MINDYIEGTIEPVGCLSILWDGPVCHWGPRKKNHPRPRVRNCDLAQLCSEVKSGIGWGRDLGFADAGLRPRLMYHEYFPEYCTEMIGAAGSQCATRVKKKRDKLDPANDRRVEVTKGYSGDVSRAGNSDVTQFQLGDLSKLADPPIP